jgi:3-oxoacyl-[acyl-carrier-protein] synthase III
MPQKALKSRPHNARKSQKLAQHTRKKAPKQAITKQRSKVGKIRLQMAKQANANHTKSLEKQLAAKIVKERGPTALRMLTPKGVCQNYACRFQLYQYKG